MFAFVVFDFIFHCYAWRLAGKNISEMTYFVSGGRKTLTYKLMSVLRCLACARLPVYVIASALWGDHISLSSVFTASFYLRSFTGMGRGQVQNGVNNGRSQVDGWVL